MIAGRLNKKIAIEHKGIAEANELGEMIDTGTRWMPARADVVWGSGKRETANLEISYPYDVTFIVWLYLHSRISEGDTVTYAGKRYLIISLEPVPEQRMLYIRAQSE